MSDNPTILRRVAAYETMIKGRYLLYLSEFFFPLDKGKRQPLFTEQLNERQQFLMLRETARHAALVEQSQMEATFQTEAFTANRDGAQERLAELARKFSEEA